VEKFLLDGPFSDLKKSALCPEGFDCDSWEDAVPQVRKTPSWPLVPP
jgi:hypothetical protein